MATIYKVEIVSDWISYSKEEFQNILHKAIKDVEREKGNVLRVKVIEKL